jgi:hypothetical protein
MPRSTSLTGSKKPSRPFIQVGRKGLEAGSDTSSVNHPTRLERLITRFLAETA